MENIKRFTLVSSDLLEDIFEKMRQHNRDQLLQKKAYQKCKDEYVYYGIPNF